MEYIELRRRADDIAREVTHQLRNAPSSNVAPVDPADFREMVWAGEAKLGTETLCEQLEENDLALPGELIRKIKEFGKDVGADKSYLNRMPVKSVE
ncbi:hypothetical protein O7626_05495 [Micromonospora sp. WMMD1102]|uniref:hypothetical protein n=1 Tax=Micromonospora sp. WMMD1102 TaxID=3016105 RepID=UPI00241523C6|nr:hypothetical protein [Micromonospora sp. WMMD1102]MDG4785391.1 hypothetical protein [Micromonospora sp. WMMD1102]